MQCSRAYGKAKEEIILLIIQAILIDDNYKTMIVKHPLFIIYNVISRSTICSFYTYNFVYYIILSKKKCQKFNIFFFKENVSKRALYKARFKIKC